MTLSNFVNHVYFVNAVLRTAGRNTMMQLMVNRKSRVGCHLNHIN